jgi:predicted enzyme related to lactoylglutathione lyase
MTTDVDRARDFYTRTMGWGTQKFDGPSDYTMWTLASTPIGGLMALPEQARAAGAPPHWLASIGSADVDATIARAVDLGGRVLVQAFDIPTVGRYGVLADPQGAVFAVYTPSMEYPPEAEPQVGEVSWHELATTDHEAALRFYTDLFGWEKTTAMDMGAMGTYQMYGRGERTYGGIYNKPPEMTAPAHWLLYVRVPDVKQSIEQIAGLGGTILNGPMEVPGGDLIAQCLDPQGAAFAVHSKAARA